MLGHRAWRKHGKKKSHLTKNKYTCTHKESVLFSFYLKDQISSVILKLVKVKYITQHIA